MRVAVSGVALAALCVAGALAAAAAARGGAQQQVTFIGDSVATEILDHQEAARLVAQGVDMDFQLAPCRRLDGVSCPYGGKAPETVMQLIGELGAKLAPTVIVAVGYNDYEDQYAGEIEKVLAALRQNGVQRVLWLTLRAVRHPYLAMNDDILAAAAKHPELTVVDWNAIAQYRDEWFGDDGLHLMTAGADAMATLIHRTLVQLGVAAGGYPKSTQTATVKPTPLVRVATRTLPTAHPGERYVATLRAAAGVRPYAWVFPKNPPDGLHVRADGTIFGTPARSGRFRFPVVVVDAAGTRAAKTLLLRVAR